MIESPRSFPPNYLAHFPSPLSSSLQSMKAFQHRVRQDQKALLRESNLANSTTKTRRREYMKKKKQDKKRKAQGLPPLPDPRDEEEDEDGEEHGERANQRAWMGPVPSFAQAEPIAFGERNDAPPDLRVPRLPDKHKAQAKSLAAAEARQRGAGKERGERGEEKRGAVGKKEKDGPSAAAAAARAKQSPAEKAKWAKLREEAQQAYRAMKESKQGPVKT